jgi:transposase-like protein
MVELVRAGLSMRKVARQFGVSLSVVQRWVKRASDQRLDRVDWADRSHTSGRPHNRTPDDLESLIVNARRDLADHSELGEYGAEAIRAHLIAEDVVRTPSTRTIGRVLERNGLLDGRHRIRRPSPPKGWYLPNVVARRAEVDSFDTVSGLVIAGGPEIVVLNGISLHGGLVTSWPRSSMTALLTAELIVDHWREFGRPAYAQFDNDTIFQGPHHYPDVVGRVSRTCLQLGVTPVFAPPREPGFQASIESYNGRWQNKVWSRSVHKSLSDLCDRSKRYVQAARLRAASRIASAPPRIHLPDHFTINLQAAPSGVIIFIRRTDDVGRVIVLGRQFSVAPHWTHRLTRVEVNFTQHTVRIFALRRREPAVQPLLAVRSYTLPRRPFREFD